MLSRVTRYGSENCSRSFRLPVVSVFLVSDIFKGICLRQAYIPSLDSHCLSLTVTVSSSSYLSSFFHSAMSLSYSFSLFPFATTFLPGFQYPMKSGDTFVDWVSNKPAFLMLYISRLSFSLCSTSFPRSPPLVFSLSPPLVFSLPPPLSLCLAYSLFSTYGRCLSRSAFIARDAERKTSLLKSCAAAAQVI